MEINRISHDMQLKSGIKVNNMTDLETRQVPFIKCHLGQKTSIFGFKHTWETIIYLSGCNFKCKGCFTARENIGIQLSSDDVVDLSTKVWKYANKQASDITVTGGEPTLNPDYLIKLVSGLKDINDRVGLYTNGYLLGQNLVQELESVQLDLLKLDLKALDPEIHYKYTGRDNSSVLKAIQLLNNSDLNFYIVTVLIPEIIDVGEIEKIAKYLSSIDNEINYLIKPFSPNSAPSNVGRAPTPEEMSSALTAAQKYLNNVEAQGITHTYEGHTLTAYDSKSIDIIEDYKKDKDESKQTEPYENTEYISFEELIL